MVENIQNSMLTQLKNEKKTVGKGAAKVQRNIQIQLTGKEKLTSFTSEFLFNILRHDSKGLDVFKELEFIFPSPSGSCSTQKPSALCTCFFWHVT